MFLQTDYYTGSESNQIRAQIPVPNPIQTNGTGYRFLVLKSNSGVVTAMPSSADSMLTPDTETVNVTWQFVENPYGTLVLETETSTVYSKAASEYAQAIVQAYSPQFGSAGNTALGVGSGLSLMDGSQTYVDGSLNSGVYNCKLADPWVAAVLSVPSSVVLSKLVYVFDTTTTNYKRKIRYVDLYRLDSGSWVLHQTFNTTSPSVGAPNSEDLILTTPLDLDASQKRIKIMCRSNYGDTNGYYWVTEFIPWVRAKS